MSIISPPRVDGSFTLGALLVRPERRRARVERLGRGPD